MHCDSPAQIIPTIHRSIDSDRATQLQNVLRKTTYSQADTQTSPPLPNHDHGCATTIAPQILRLRPWLYLPPHHQFKSGRRSVRRRWPGSTENILSRKLCTTSRMKPVPQDKVFYYASPSDQPSFCGCVAREDHVGLELPLRRRAEKFSGVRPGD